MLPFDDPMLAGRTVGDVLADPERFEGETLADPLEGVAYGRCVAKDHAPGRRHAVDPLFRPRPHHLRAQTRRRQPYARRCSRRRRKRWWRPLPCLPPAPTSTRSRWQELRQLAKKLSGIGLRAIDSALKAAQQQQAAQNAKAMRALRPPAGSDPRPRIRAPLNDEPWLPQMDVLNEVIGAVVADTPPARDIDDDATQMHKLPISGTHAFTDANQEGDEE